jgi:ubiquinone/menaquinone biosynthesis C-methylase UbiE
VHATEASAERRVAGQGRPHDTRRPDVETASHAYAVRFAGPVGAWMLGVQALRVAELLTRAGAPRGLHVLEVGGGHAQLTPSLLEAGHDVVVHGSAVACHDRPVSACGCAGVRVAPRRVVSDLWALPFRDGAFDLVAALRVLPHVTEWRTLVAEMARVSRRFVLVDFPTRSALHRAAPALFAVKRRIERNTRPYFDYDVADVAGALRDAGLAVVASQREFALPMVVHRTAARPAMSRWLEARAERAGLTDRIGSPVLMLAQR